MSAAATQESAKTPTTALMAVRSSDLLDDLSCDSLRVITQRQNSPWLSDVPTVSESRWPEHSFPVPQDCPGTASFCERFELPSANVLCRLRSDSRISPGRVGTADSHFFSGSATSVSQGRLTTKVTDSRLERDVGSESDVP